MPDIDIVVPTVPGREEYLERLKASAKEFVPDHRMIVVTDVPSCGIGWREGIKRSSADYLLLTADDCEIMNGLETCIEAVDDGYLPAPIVYRPDGGIESAGGDMNAPGCLLRDIQPDWTPVDFTTIPFVGRDQIKKIRMIDSHMQCDVWVSHRGRQLGYETVLLHDFQMIHHHLEVGRKRGTDPADSQIFAEAMANV